MRNLSRYLAFALAFLVFGACSSDPAPATSVPGTSPSIVSPTPTAPPQSSLPVASPTSTPEPPLPVASLTPTLQPSLPSASPIATSPPDLGLAPDFANDVWINTDEPLTLDKLRGKVVLVEFWTFG